METVGPGRLRKDLDSWRRRGTKGGDIQSSVGMGVLVMRDGQEFRASWPQQGPAVVGRVTWKVYTAEVVLEAVVPGPGPPFQQQGSTPRLLRSQGFGVPRILILAEGICLVQGHASSLGTTHTPKVGSAKAQPLAHSGHLWRRFWASELPEDLLRLLPHLLHGSTPPSAQFCFLHSLNRALTRNSLQGSLYFRVSFLGNVFIPITNRSGLRKQNLNGTLELDYKPATTSNGNAIW